MRGGALVTSASSSRDVAAATSSTARANAASLAFEGARDPLTLRTYCSDAARISSGVVGGSKLDSVRMFRHEDESFAPCGLAQPVVQADERLACRLLLAPDERGGELPRATLADVRV